MRGARHRQSRTLLERPAQLISAADHQAVQLAAASYRAASNPRSRPRSRDGSGDYHLDDRSRARLRSMSRTLERDCDFYDALLGSFADYVVGEGPQPQPQLEDAEWSEQLADLWREQAVESAGMDVCGRHTLTTTLHLVIRSLVRDGEMWAWENQGRLATYEAETIEHIEHDGQNRPLWYRTFDKQVYNADDLHHLAHVTRISQSRGAPVLTAGLDDWWLLNSLYEAETTSAESASLPWVLIEHQQAHAIPPSGGLQAGAPTAIAPGGMSTPAGWQRTPAGSMMGMPRGLTAKAWAPDRPNLSVPEFVISRLRYLCAPLLPYEAAFHDYGSLNYAAIRGLRRTVERIVRRWRVPHLQPLLTLLYRDNVRRWILQGRLPYRPGWEQVAWKWPEVPIQDREKDALADERELDNGTTSLPHMLGSQWRQRIREQEEADAYREQIRREFRQQAGLPDPEPEPSRSTT